MKTLRNFGLFAAVAAISFISVANTSFALDRAIDLTQGTLVFSPDVVKNGGAFTITVSGAPASSDIRLWVDNSDGKGFQDFGVWGPQTDANGYLQVNRTLNCDAYQTLTPGQTVAVGNRILTQKVYFEYVGKGVSSPTATHTKDCTVATPSGPVTITSLSPSSGVVNTTVTITGTGFTAAGNTIYFGDGFVTLNNYTSNGTSITFKVPYALPSTPPGDYMVSVMNANGTSNKVKFTVPNPTPIPTTPTTGSDGYWVYPTNVQANCIGCLGTRSESGVNVPNEGSPIFPYATPIKRFVGRFLDSAFAVDRQQPRRTYRTYDAQIAADRDRVYMIMGGGTFASYKLSTFFSQDLGKPMKIQAIPYNENRYPELYLPYMAEYDAEDDSRWKDKPVIDGQQRLLGFDWDDRGFVYLAYSVFGWGVVRDNGTSISLIKEQNDYPSAGVTSEAAGVCGGSIKVVKSGSKYYAVCPQVDRLSSTAVVDVTFPDAAKIMGSVYTVFDDLVKAGTKDGQTVFGTFYSKSGVQIGIYTTDAFINNQSAIFSLTSGNTNGTIYQGGESVSYSQIASDGTNFYTIRRRTRLWATCLNGWLKWGSGCGDTEIANDIGIIRKNSDGTYSATFYPMTAYVDRGSAFKPVSLSVNGGYLATLSLGGTFKLFKLGTGAPTEVPTNNFVRQFYFSPPTGYAKLGSYTVPEYVRLYVDQGKTYLMLGAFDIGDVFELDSSGFTPPPPTPIYACNDGLDNDNDGLKDFGSDPGCASATDNDETNTASGGTGGGGTGGTIGSGGACAQYTDYALRTVCEQIEALKADACRLSPSLSFCTP